jgi:hypothetical protein
MKPIQWLLIGGPGHGKNLWVEGGNSVLYSETGFNQHQYDGKDYLTDGKLYRIGVHNATAEQMEKIPLLIKEINLEALSNIQ